MHVMAGVLRRPDGQVLITERPAGKHLAGFWEFPGGKLDPGEAPPDGLARELYEELGIRIVTAEPLLALPWRYDSGQLLLDTWLVLAWQGMPQSLERQALEWVAPAELAPGRLAPADREILRHVLAR
jgi:8-oxo-dGTP diphosphatase